jgi:nicotinamide riboside kinase
MYHIKPRVFFCGASGTGKSTLCDLVAREFHLDTRTSPAREAARNLNVGVDIHSSPETRYDFAHETLRVYRKADPDFEQLNGYVSERTIFDVIAYPAFLVQFSPCHPDAELNESISIVKGDNPKYPLRKSVVFVTRPNRTIFEAAINQNDRTTHLKWESLLRFDGAITALMSLYHVHYVPLEGDDFLERSRVVMAAVRNAHVQNDDPGTLRSHNVAVN